MRCTRTVFLSIKHIKALHTEEKPLARETPTREPRASVDAGDAMGKPAKGKASGGTNNGSFGSSTRKGTGFTSGPTKHRTGKTLGGGVEFAKKRLKVGKKVAKHASATDTTIRSKAIRLTAQNIRSVELDGGAQARETWTLAEECARAASKRGVPLAELLNQCGHYSGKTRADGLSGLLELAEGYPGAVRARAADVVERVGERLADTEASARRAARECLRKGVVPALGAKGLAPFAKTLILYAGAALTHVADGVRKDAPAALDALLDAAPALVAAHAPASILGHLGELLRRGDDGGVGTGSSAQRGVGSQKPAARLALLRSTRRFLETLSEETSDVVVQSRSGDSGASTSSTFVWGEASRNGVSTRSIGALYSERARRAPANVLTAHGAVQESVDAEGRGAVRANARRLVELVMCVWDDAAQTLTDERGVDVDRVRVMSESMACARLALQLADCADEVEIWDTGGGLTAIDIMPEIARRTLVAFPSSSPAAVVEKQDVQQVREALVSLNFETCRFLVSASSSVASAALVRELPPGTMEALPHVLSRALQYIASALRGVALDGGSMGDAEETREEAFGDVLGMARDALSLPAWCFSAGYTGTACTDIVAAVTETWNDAVSSQDGERVTHCVSLLTTVLPEEARQGYARIPIETAASWVRHIPRVLWSLKHENPRASQQLLSLLHDVAARNPPGSPLADVLSQCESEMAVLFYMVPPAGSPESAKSRPGPFARLPFAIQCSAVQLIGVLPILTPPTVRALAKMCLDADRVNVEIPVVAIEALQSNVLASPLDLTVSFLATLLAGAPGVAFLDKSSKRDVAAVDEKAWQISRRLSSSAASALVAFGDADTPWNGALLASGALRQMWAMRVDKGDVDGATRTAGGFAALAASAAEFAQSSSKGNVATDEADLAATIADVLSWHALHAEPDKGVDVDVVWRTMRAAPELACLIARAAVSLTKSNASTMDRCVGFLTALIQSGVVQRGPEGSVDELAKVIDEVKEHTKTLGKDVFARAQGLDVVMQVAFGAR